MNPPILFGLVPDICVYKFFYVVLYMFVGFVNCLFELYFELWSSSGHVVSSLELSLTFSM